MVLAFLTALAIFDKLNKEAIPRWLTFGFVVAGIFFGRHFIDGLTMSVLIILGFLIADKISDGLITFGGADFWVMVALSLFFGVGSAALIGCVGMLLATVVTYQTKQGEVPFLIYLLSAYCLINLTSVLFTGRLYLGL